MVRTKATSHWLPPEHISISRYRKRNHYQVAKSTCSYSLSTLGTKGSTANCMGTCRELKTARSLSHLDRVSPVGFSVAGVVEMNANYM